MKLGIFKEKKEKELKICFYEQMEDIASYKTEAEMVARLKLYSQSFFKTLFDYTFNPSIVWLLPEGPIEFTPLKDGGRSLNMRLYQEMRKLPNFLNIGPYPNLDKKKRVGLFVNVLESIHPKDAILLNHIKDKKLPFPNITKEIVAQAYPIISQNWGIEKKNLKIEEIPIVKKKRKPDTSLHKCEYCGKEIVGRLNYGRWHGKKCSKYVETITESQEINSN